MIKNADGFISLEVVRSAPVTGIKTCPPRAVDWGGGRVAGGWGVFVLTTGVC